MESYFLEADIARFYRDSGYDFLSITDHGILTDTSRFTSKRFLTIPGRSYASANPRTAGSPTSSR